MDTPEEPWASSATPSSRPASPKSGRSSRTARSQTSSRATEVTPLLARDDASDDEEDETEQPPARRSLLQALTGSTAGKLSVWRKRWPSILALLLLCILAVLILLGFLATEGMEEYAMQAAEFKPTKLSLDSLTKTGVRVQVEGDFRMDASRVKKQSVRNIGRFGTWIAKEAETGAADVDVFLPDHGDVLIGTARIPGIKVSIRNGHTTHVSFLADLEPGSLDDIRTIAHDYLDGQLGDIRVKGKAAVPLQSGLIHLGKQLIEESVVFGGNKLPALPKYNITRLNIREADKGHKGMGADASLLITNEFPLDFTVPPVSVNVLVDGCSPSDEHIMLGTAETESLHIEPKTDLNVNVTGRVEKLPEALTEACPNSAKSPLDSLLGDYMHGEAATIYINCCNFPDPETPQWTRDLLKDITVPVPFTGREMGDLIKNFSLTDVEFFLPEFFADPDSPEASPRISAVVNVLIGLPSEMNFRLGVDRVMAVADVFYHKKKLGVLRLDKWQKANSTRIEAHGEEGPSLLVSSDVKKAPLDVTDSDVFEEVLQAVIMGEPLLLTVKAAVSVGVDTPVGKFAVRDIPAEGVVPIKRSRRANVHRSAIGGGKPGHGDKKKNPMSAINLKLGNLSILDTSRSSITFGALINFTNPTNYSATVPYFNINLLVNETIIAQATTENIRVLPGNNTNVPITAVWDPLTHGGEDGRLLGAEFLSQYISSFNTSLTIQTHDNTIPAQPFIGRVLSKFPLTFPTPGLHSKAPSDDPEDPEDPDKDKDSPHFIQDATMHILSSTALFILASPFSTTTLYITNLNATAFYEGNPSGTILYELPFAVPPGLSETPRLPVDWSFGSVGYEAIKKALGGTLRLSAFAHVGIRIGEWKETVWFKGGGIGAHVRL
ncbi:hypothetical protein P154DRAFT_440973 [Amniculicola lignicola CBS 123094]|uniref:Pre-rrna processing protein n=1 Tax=Amniculicola lignicola CBS 123094 TaxID=1392246 RepID=A0A6A5W8V0_9PLEO|nr:hypothetical protein P154DRAFT_440973 [Amniculicola lignicola CBS 123094]